MFKGLGKGRRPDPVSAGSKRFSAGSRGESLLTIAFPRGIMEMRWCFVGSVAGKSFPVRACLEIHTRLLQAACKQLLRLLEASKPFLKSRFVWVVAAKVSESKV